MFNWSDNKWYGWSFHVWHTNHIFCFYTKTHPIQEALEVEGYSQENSNTEWGMWYKWGESDIKSKVIMQVFSKQQCQPLLWCLIDMGLYPPKMSIWRYLFVRNITCNGRLPWSLKRWRHLYIAWHDILFLLTPLKYVWSQIV